MRVLLCFLILSTIIIQSFTPREQSQELSYLRDIEPILSAHCYRCHTSSAKGGYDFRNFNDVKRASEKGTLIGAIKWLPGFVPMPVRRKKLDDATILRIENWIKAGMKN